MYLSEISRKPDCKTILYLIDDTKIDDIQFNADIVYLKIEDWNSELSPWPIDKFAGRADKTIEQLKDIINECETGYQYEKRYIVGYSLAGLFGWYAYSKMECFDGVVSCSASLWYPNFKEYIVSSNLKQGKFYISLGDKEALTKNKLMQPVQQVTQWLYDYLKEQSKTIFFLNPGGHFNQPLQRIEKGIEWILRKD